MATKSSKNKKSMIVLICAIAVILLISLIIFSFVSQKTQTTNIYDKDLGWVTIKTTSNNVFLNWVTSLFGFLKQAVLFPSGTHYINDTITITDYFNVSGTEATIGLPSGKKCFLGSFVVTITSPVKSTDLPAVILTNGAKNFDSLTNNINIIPASEGQYSAITVYREAMCNALDGSNCISDTHCLGTWTSPGLNTMNVVARDTSCSQEDYRSPLSGYDEQDISNGKLGKADYHVFTAPSCSNTIDHSEYQTSCNSGYHCSTLTDADNVCPIQDSCSANSQVPSENCIDNPATVVCTSPQVCNNITKTCENIRCNANTTQSCSSGGYIITSLCNNGTLIPINPTPTCPTGNGTNLTCTPVTIPCCNNTLTVVTKNCTNNVLTSTNLTCPTTCIPLNITCYSLKSPFVSQVAFGKKDCTAYSINSNVCDSQKGLYPTNQACIDAQPEFDYVLWGTILGSVLLIIIIIVVIVMRKKRK